MAIQMSAVQLGGAVSLIFTTVLDQVRFGLVDEDEEVHEATDRAISSGRGSDRKALDAYSNAAPAYVTGRARQLAYASLARRYDSR